MNLKLVTMMSIAMVLLLAVPFTSAYADGGPKQTALSLTLTGGVVNAGDQHYTQQGGIVVGGMVQTQLVDPSTATLHYSMNANVQGLSTSGSSTLRFSGTLLNGTQISIKAKTDIVDTANAVLFPMGCTGATCTSEIPPAFVGESTVTLSTEKSDSQVVTVMPVMIESAYDNPWGGPIVISFGSSPADQITIVTTYTSAHIRWEGVQMGGTVSTSSTGPIVGNFLMTVSSSENLVTGVERDHGSITLGFALDTNTINLKGHFDGTSTIPTTGAIDCSPTGLPGTCTMTGLQSSGNMRLHGDHMHYDGTYSTMWTVPAIGFTSTVSATTSNSQSDDSN